MRKYISITIALLMSLSLTAQDGFYYYRDQKISLNANTQYLFVLTNSADQNDLLRLFNVQVIKFLKDNGTSTLQHLHADRGEKYWAEVKFSNPLNNTDLRKQIETLEASNKVLMVAPFYKNDQADKIGLSHYLSET